MCIFLPLVRAGLFDDVLNKGLDVITAPVKKFANTAADFLQFPDMSLQPQTAYTYDELEQYDGEEGRDLLIAVMGKVYNITFFAPYHPGGVEPLKKYGGRDASLAVRLTKMPPQVFDVFAERFRVGYIENYDSLPSYVKDKK